MINTYCRLSCTQCGNEFYEESDHATHLRCEAKKSGWQYKKVPNGSFWDFCPQCVNDNKKELTQ